jgi:agmatinase
MARYGGMFGPDVTFLGVERCDLDDRPATPAPTW